MISWIVASHQPDVLAANLAATLTLSGGDELVLVENAPSIAAAYNEGQDRATQPIRCYIHHDVQILDMDGLRSALVDACTAERGMVGVIGSRTHALPWWDGVMVGRVRDSRLGLIGPGGSGVVRYLDGLLLATAQAVVWDEGYPGWHLYDHDVCRQMTERGLPNWCIGGGDRLVLHNTTGSTNTAHLRHFDDNMRLFKAKWEVPA